MPADFFPQTLRLKPELFNAIQEYSKARDVPMAQAYRELLTVGLRLWKKSKQAKQTIKKTLDTQVRKDVESALVKERLDAETEQFIDEPKDAFDVSS